MGTRLSQEVVAYIYIWCELRIAGRSAGNPPLVNTSLVDCHDLAIYGKVS